MSATAAITYVSKSSPTITNNLTLPTSYTAITSGQLGYTITNTISASSTTSLFAVSTISSSSLSTGVWLFSVHINFVSIPSGITYFIVQMSSNTSSDSANQFRLSNVASNTSPSVTFTRIVVMSTVSQMVLSVQVSPNTSGINMTGEFSCVRIA